MAHHVGRQLAAHGVKGVQGCGGGAPQIPVRLSKQHEVHRVPLLARGWVSGSCEEGGEGVHV
jgi:hypothetical protein